MAITWASEQVPFGKRCEGREQRGASSLCAKMSETVPTPDITDEGETG